MRAVKHRLLAVSVLLLALTEVRARDEIHCEANRALTRKEGEYARKDIWEAIPRAADWRALDKLLSSGAALSVSVRANGEYYAATNGWHESAATCIKFPAGDRGQLWITAVDGSGARDRDVADVVKSAKWEGPFSRIGPAHAEKRLYFQRLFGTACFRTQRGASWCFGPGYIEHGSSTYLAELVLDRTEMPNYGFPVIAADSSTKQERLWVFVRSGDGWQVFDEKLDLKDRPPGGATRKPWLTLTLDAKPNER
jgi:hypothetical protein